jgi:crossover junction endodeoxyribonuclease RusA
MTPTPPTFRLEVEAGRVVGCNQAPRDKRAAWRIARVWRDAAYWLAKDAKLPRLGSAEVDITVHLRAGVRADAQNYPSGPSVKGLLDGLVRAGVITDDSGSFLVLGEVRCRPLDGGRPRVVVELRPKGREGGGS